MKISRRNFLGALSASAAVVFPLTGRALAASKSAFIAPSDALAQLGWSSFYPYINTEFQFEFVISGQRPRTGRVGLTLSAMGQDASLRGVPAGGDPRCFLLTFKATADSRRLEQNTYPVEHFALGRFELFISEGNLVDNEYVYTAVINRTTK